MDAIDNEDYVNIVDDRFNCQKTGNRNKKLKFNIAGIHMKLFIWDWKKKFLHMYNLIKLRLNIVYVKTSVTEAVVIMNRQMCKQIMLV